MLTQWFDPEPGAKGLLFAGKLRDLGHEVEVLTGFPNYPGGKMYPGYRQSWLNRSVIDGISVTRVPLYPSHSGSAIGRVLNYTSFLASSCLYGLLGAKKADIIYVYHPPITAGVSAALIGLFRRIPFVIDLQDLWPDTLRATGMLNNERILSLAGAVCDWTYRRATHIVVLSPGFRKILIKRGVPEAKLSIIYNWCDEGALTAEPDTQPDTSYMDGCFNVVFAGNMGKAQALDAVLRAAQIVAAAEPLVRIVLVGGGVEVEPLKAMAAELGVTNVRFVPRVSMTEVGAIMRRADGLLVHLKDDALFSITIPSKTQAYMAVGKPVLMAVPGDAADLVQQAEAGVCMVPENPQSVADGILQLARMTPAARQQMGENGARFYQQHLSFESGSAKFSALFKQVLARRGGPKGQATS